MRRAQEESAALARDARRRVLLGATAGAAEGWWTPSPPSSRPVTPGTAAGSADPVDGHRRAAEAYRTAAGAPDAAVDADRYL